jgi:hypothetical protein
LQQKAARSFEDTHDEEDPSSLSWIVKTMTIPYPFDASRAGAGLRHGAQPGAAAPRLQRGRTPHAANNPFQQRRFNVRGWAGNGSSTSTVDDGGQAQLSLERQKEAHVGSVQTQTGGITMEEGTNRTERRSEHSALARVTFEFVAVFSLRHV